MKRSRPRLAWRASETRIRLRLTLDTRVRGSPYRHEIMLRGLRLISIRSCEARVARVFARAGRDGTIRIDTGKIERGLASYSAANPRMSKEQVSDSLGGRAVAHDTQHVIDYKNSELGYPTSRGTASLVERSAYSTQAAFDQGAGLNSDLWNPQMTPEQRSQAIEAATGRSVNNVWGDP